MTVDQSRSPKRVLMIAPACDGEDVGEAWVAFQWVKRMSERHNLTLLTTYKGGHTPTSMQLRGLRVVEWPEPAGLGKFERLNSLMQPGYVPFYFRARQWVREQVAEGEQFDIAHQVVPVAMRYPSPAARLGIPLVVGPIGGSLESPPSFVQEEGQTPWWQRFRRFDRWRIRHDPWLRATYESAACVIGVADYVRDFLGALSLHRFEVLSETAVDALPKPVVRTDRKGPVRLLYVGRIIRTKGLRDAIRAVGQVRHLDIELDVVGDGNDRAACERLVADLHLGGRVKFHGKLPREVVDGYYERADIFVFPSYREPGGNVCLEAMSFGLPVIVCRRGGSGANVDDTCAISLDAESPAQLANDCADGIYTLATNAELRSAMGKAAREHVRRSHLWSQRVDRMDRLYEEVGMISQL